MKKFLTPLIFATALCASPAHAISASEQQVIAQTLKSAGLTTPIKSVVASGIGDLLLLTLDNPTQEPLLITPDARFIIQGKPERNPSPAKSIASELKTPKAVGTPVEGAYRQALLDNTKALKNMTADTAFFYTNVAGILWGVSGNNGTQFLISDDGRWFVNGEVSMIADGQFVGLDTDFEWAKNRHVLATLDEDTLTIYPAKNPKATVYVATDINCPYCRMFHKKIKEFNAKGITVKAIGYPVYDESPEPMRQIWCERDNSKRANLLSLAMQGINPTKQCKDNANALTANQKHAQALAIMATPSIYREDGVLFEGDFTTDEFLQFLETK